MCPNRLVNTLPLTLRDRLVSTTDQPCMCHISLTVASTSSQCKEGTMGLFIMNIILLSTAATTKCAAGHHSTHYYTVMHSLGTKARINVCLFPSLLLNHLLECLCCEALGPLNGQAKSTVPEQRAEDAKCSRHTKEDSVVAHLCHSIILCVCVCVCVCDVCDVC